MIFDIQQYADSSSALLAMHMALMKWAS